MEWKGGGRGLVQWVTVVLTEILQHPVAFKLRVPDLVLQQNQLLLILVLEGLQPSLTVLQLIDQLLFDLDLAGQVSQVSLKVHLWGSRDGCEPAGEKW